MSNTRPKLTRVDVSTIYGATTKRPLVQLKVGSHSELLTPSKARALGMLLINASHTAEADAILVRFMEHHGIDTPRRGALRRAFHRERRAMREADAVADADTPVVDSDDLPPTSAA